MDGISGANRQFAVALARAFGGAILFSLPLLMTMEMWWLGFYMSPLKLALLLLLFVPLLARLSFFAGFEETFEWKDELAAAFVAYAVGFVSSAVVLCLFGVLTPQMSVREAIGMISFQAVPASIGAMLARSQLGGTEEREKERKDRATFGGEFFLMGVGALFLAFNVAPTEEIVRIGHKMTQWHAVALAVFSLLLMHAFVYSAGFHGQAEIPEGTPQWSEFLRYTVAGYALALIISAYVLWTFDRTGGMAPQEVVKITLVLGFPAAVGAAAARLIL